MIYIFPHGIRQPVRYWKYRQVWNLFRWFPQYVRISGRSADLPAFCNANGYTVVREIGGHGVGLEFHEEPWVGYNSRRGTQMVLAPGMIFTIEPMVNMGGVEIFIDEENDWEVYTEDGMPSAQWEIMVLVTEDGHEVLSW